MLIAVRHGRTDMNEDGTERARGWLPVALTLDGMEKMAHTGELLSEVEDVYALYCSDLVRAVQSAEEIARAISKEIEPREELRDWNVGSLAGQDIKKIMGTIHGYIDDPNKVVEGGESYQNFLNRAIPFLHELVESEDICIAVTHNRVITLVKALSINDGEYPDTATLKKKGPIEPAGFMIIRPDWKISFITSKAE